MDLYTETKRILQEEPRIEEKLQSSGVWGMFSANLESGDEVRIGIAHEAVMKMQISFTFADALKGLEFLD